MPQAQNPTPFPPETSIMRALLLRRIPLGPVVAVLLILAGATPAYGQTGATITGHFLHADGSPVADARVQVNGEDGFTFLAATSTDADGAYTVEGLPAGAVKVAFIRDGLSQWAHGKRNVFEADVITVADGATTTVDEVALPTGRITGTLLDPAGQPAPGVDVRAFSVNGDGSQGFARTGDDGRFDMLLFPATYLVSFSLPYPGPTQYWHGRTDFTQADPVTVAADQQAVVDDQLLPTGSMSGRFTTVDGQPLAGQYVDVSNASGTAAGGFAVTDATGNWALPQVFAGTYIVRFLSPDFTRSQYAFGKLTAEQADRITVTAGHNTVVDDSALPTGSVSVTAKDASTGSAIANFCAGVGPIFGCSDGTGVVTLNGITQGTQDLYGYAPDGQYFGTTTTVTVVGGATTSAVLTLKPAALITTTIVDSATGAPAPNACVVPVTGLLGMLPQFGGYCADDRGNVHMGPLDPDTYRLYATPGWDDTVHGAQWVGPAGGTGDQLLASQVKPKVGVATAIPPIRLDHAGTVTGTVIDAATQAPIQFAVVTNSAFHPGIGPSGNTSSTDAAGKYTLTRLGPYRWPLFYSDSLHAPQWTDQVADRLLSRGVLVIPDGTTTADAALTTGTAVTVNLTGSGAAAAGYVTATNGVTNDITGFCFVDPGAGSCVLRALGNQTVSVSFFGDDAAGHSVAGSTSPVLIGTRDFAITLTVSPPE
jgi:5-hydroxyisourate hydrolase-like protein (transthyretin family)